MLCDHHKKFMTWKRCEDCDKLRSTEELERLDRFDELGFISHRIFQQDEPELIFADDGVFRLGGVVCGYCQGRGTYDPFVGPTAECPKCRGAGGV